jgi:uncharacterized protein (DUF697 family)
MEGIVHDIDRTQLEIQETGYETSEFEFQPEIGGELGMESPFSEAEEMELAAELLGISSEEELDHFLGKLISGAWKGIKKVGSVVGKVIRPLGSVLKGIAKKALPLVGGALGSIIPGAGTAIGTALGGALSKALEAEFEGMNAEDREFEMAKRFVRLAGSAAKQAALIQPGVNPQIAATKAVIAAARKHVPGFQTGLAQPLPNGSTVGTLPAAPIQSGRWIRRGRKIVLLGV